MPDVEDDLLEPEPDDDEEDLPDPYEPGKKDPQDHVDI